MNAIGLVGFVLSPLVPADRVSWTSRVLLLFARFFFIFIVITDAFLFFSFFSSFDIRFERSQSRALRWQRRRPVESLGPSCRRLVQCLQETQLVYKGTSSQRRAAPFPRCRLAIALLVSCYRFAGKEPVRRLYQSDLSVWEGDPARHCQNLPWTRFLQGKGGSGDTLQGAQGILHSRPWSRIGIHLVLPFWNGVPLNLFPNFHGGAMLFLFLEKLWCILLFCNR